jgi:hypothetical protein
MVKIKSTFNIGTKININQLFIIEINYFVNNQLIVHLNFYGYKKEKKDIK